MSELLTQCCLGCDRLKRSEYVATLRVQKSVRATSGGPKPKLSREEHAFECYRCELTLEVVSLLGGTDCELFEPRQNGTF